MSSANHHHRADLVSIATDAMKERGLEAEFSDSVHQQLTPMTGPDAETDLQIRDLTSLLWCSIDNDDSLDLDQLTVGEILDDGYVKIFVAVADVDALVKKGSAIDEHAQINTTSVFTSAKVFPMLPTRLSNDLTSLNLEQDRLALVTEMIIAPDGAVTESSVYRAKVRNKAKLAYDAVSAWIDGAASLPDAADKVPGMDSQLRMQDSVAQGLRKHRHTQGSLELETFQPKAVFVGEQVTDIRQQEQNRARQLIEELMIATNNCNAHFLASHGGASLRRVVRSPDRWLRIVQLAKKYNENLPDTPDSRALERFLARRHMADPLRFPDLSLVVIKLMGPGEYVVEDPDSLPIGHFGLAVQDYTHSTAPNRRYPDLITLRMLKGILSERPRPYGEKELESLAIHCTQQEDAARKVERRVRKSEAALFLEPQIGRHFDAIVTGVTESGTWVRTFVPPVEGMLLQSRSDLDVGHQIRVKLISTNVELGFIDFVLVD
jgi:exoribonuclease II